jgi:hypothetical protein
MANVKAGKEDVELGDEDPGALSRATSRRQSLSSSLSRSAGYGYFGGSNPLEGQAMGSTREDDEEALKWAALEKLPTFDRLRTSVLQKESGSMRQVDVKDLSTTDFNHLLEKVYRTTDDEHNHLLSKVRKRLDR